MHEDQTALVTATGAQLLIPLTTRAHLMAHPTVWPVLGEAVARVALPETENACSVEIDLGRRLQRSTLLPAPILDLHTATSFALRHNRAYPSRVTEEAPTTWDSTVVLRVRRTDASSPFELATAYIGALSPLEPWDPHIASQADFQIALDFWSRHGLVYDDQVMQPVFISNWGEILRKARSTLL